MLLGPSTAVPELAGVRPGRVPPLPEPGAPSPNLQVHACTWPWHTPLFSHVVFLRQEAVLLLEASPVPPLLPRKNSHSFFHLVFLEPAPRGRRSQHTCSTCPRQSLVPALLTVGLSTGR